MLKSRNLLVIGVILITLMAVTIPLASAQPVQQATTTPEATVAATDTPEATVAAPAVSPLATPGVTGTPSTLPTTGGSDDGAAALSLIVVALGALILLGAFGLAMSRRTR